MVKKKYLIIGKSGFMGSCLYSAISKLPNTECHAIASKDCNLLSAKQTDSIIPSLSESAIVVYCAGITRLRSDDGIALNNNLTMLYNLTEALKKSHPHKVIFFSSVEIYGIPSNLPINENTELEPETLYGVGKITAELMLQRWRRQSKVPIAILRLPGIYGPGDNGFGFIGALIKTIKEQNEFNLVGGGVEFRDYVYVEDIVKIVIKLSDVSFDELILNIATGKSVAISEIIQQVFDMFGECHLNYVPQIQKLCHLKFDISALRNNIPQLSMTTLEEGLKKYKEK